MRVLVVTVVHHPLDARIHRRQIGALLDAGEHVTYAAPWTATGAVPPKELDTRDLPRAVGRRRLGPIRAARHLILREVADHDLVLLHDPDLLIAVRGEQGKPIVWDVHEDTAAALTDRFWLPGALVRPARWMVRWAEAWAERNVHLLLAEDAYAERFAGEHPVVPNVPVVPPSVAVPGADRVVHVGRISRGRGWDELRSVASALATDGITVELFGAADPDIEDEVRTAAESGQVLWHGFVPNADVLARIDGALAGLSLLRDLPNYAHSMPTKIAEYLAHGVPAIATPLPLARVLVERSGGGLLTSFGDPEAVAAAILQLRNDEALRRRLASLGHAYAQTHLNWRLEGARFVEQLRRWAATSRGAPVDT